MKKTKKSKQVAMPMGEFLKEHDRLIKVLKKGSKSARSKEAKEQSEEVKEYKKKK